MKIRAAPEPAKPSDRALARQRVALAARELPQVRAAALAWSKGMAAVLAGLLGFGLIKGRTDVGSLADPVAVGVGLLLLLALGAGVTAAWCLLRAAYGRPIKVTLDRLGQDSHGSPLALEHVEALSAGRAMTLGLRWGLSCVVLLVLAVGTTWYGPAKDDPRLLVTTPGGVRCGEVVGFERGTVTLKSATGRAPVDLTTASWVKGVDACPTSNP